MKKYTIDTLIEINPLYHAQHTLIQSDVDKANKLIEFIEKTRTQSVPQIGDIVEFTSEYGDYYENAHIETVSENEIYICEKPSVPFIYTGLSENRLSTSTSGGAWTYIPKNLEYVGTKEKLFKDWGHCGACGNGAIQFRANVNVWRYIKGNSKFTTKTHDRFFVYVSEKPDPYKYTISKCSGNYIAFRTDKEYNAWLKTFHGIEEVGPRGNKIVWTFKQEELCVPLIEYLKVSNAIIDSTMCNGTIQECKRIIEENKITTYLPHQNDRIPLNTNIEFINAYEN